MTLNEFQQHIFKTYGCYEEHFRYGQYLMDELCKVNPKLHNQLLSEEDPCLDPYYNNDNCAEFWNYLERHWK